MIIKDGEAPGEAGAGTPADKIVLRNVFKLFGQHVPRAISMIQAGQGKAEIQAETRCTIGVNDASFSIREGEIFVVMGLSGSGKSTLLRLLNRLIEPTLGSILVDGQDVTRMTKRERASCITVGANSVGGTAR